MSKAAKASFPRLFSTAGRHPFQDIVWEKRTASITDDKGKVIFKQEDVEVPASWSMLATNIVASKYFYGEPGTPARETSVGQLISRVVDTIADWGLKDGYFDSSADADIFRNELAYLLVNQYGAFNSPVWFNCGLFHRYKAGSGSTAGGYYWDPKTASIKRETNQYRHPQSSACFIQSVQDNMDSLLQLAVSEAMLFKFGSGTGTDLSAIRSSKEKLSGGGKPSGPLSFLRIYDTIAGIVKSGGKTRRAAKMNTLKDWHPDIMEFIQAKSNEEKKAWALIEQGYDGSFNGDAYGSVMFQNENLSVRLSDKFMQAVEAGETWATHWVTKPDVAGPTYPARDILQAIAEGTHLCGDPGVQFEDTIQRWHTCKADGPINSSNPCSEYMFLDDTACNLASLNLLKFLNLDGSFDVVSFQRAVNIFIIAQDILVDNSSYPTELIALNSHKYRTLGLGYANLGAVLMAKGLPYDSQQGRDFAGQITALMHLEAYCASGELAKRVGTFERYEANRSAMQAVIAEHACAQADICPALVVPGSISDAIHKASGRMLDYSREYGFRNAQVTVLAPTGTIGFLMDCDTTGVEPDIALVKYKVLAGGGMLKIVNGAVGRALATLGYDLPQINRILEYIAGADTIEGAPDLKEEHLPVFDCAFKPANGKRSIHPTGHIKMMAAVQPFLSGAISKTVNMPTDATVADIVDAYKLGHFLGLKALAIYRDGSKRSQPLNTSKDTKHADDPKAQADGILSKLVEMIVANLPNPNLAPQVLDLGTSGKEELILRLFSDLLRQHHASVFGERKRLPETRNSKTHKFAIAGHEGYITVGLYEDGQPGEVFIQMSKEGSTIGGLMDAIGISTSIGLQYGVPLKAFIDKFRYTKFDPSGFCQGKDIRSCTSVLDYIFHWLELQFYAKPEDKVSPADMLAMAKTTKPGVVSVQKPVDKVGDQFKSFMLDAPVCDTCGSITVRNGACFKCYNCGASLGCS